MTFVHCGLACAAIAVEPFVHWFYTSEPRKDIDVLEERQSATIMFVVESRITVFNPGGALTIVYDFAVSRLGNSRSPWFELRKLLLGIVVPSPEKTVGWTTSSTSVLDPGGDLAAVHSTPSCTASEILAFIPEVSCIPFAFGFPYVRVWLFGSHGPASMVFVGLGLVHQWISYQFHIMSFIL